MANTSSAKKATRVSARRMRSVLRNVEEALAKGDKAAAEVALKAAQPEIMRGAQKGVLHKNAASRKVARLTKRVRAVAG